VISPTDKFPRAVASAAFAVSLLALSGCSSFMNRAATEPVVDTTVSPSYRIGPGDGLNIIVWRNPEVSMAVTVRPDGKISTPLVEDLQASGRTPTELARDVERSLSKVIQAPTVTVVVTSFIGMYDQQVRVIGQAAKPQALQYRENMSLMDVMIAVGGMTDFASGNNAKIVRNMGGKQQTIPVRLNDLIRDGDVAANMRIYPGDVLVIPESFF
jgi:polysaccharide export outer membrane protein